MNITETLTFIRDALLEQGCKSKLGNICAYRGENGARCAVGHLIKDEFYSRDLENLPHSASKVQFALEMSGVKLTEKMNRALRQAQVIHDTKSMFEWEIQFNNLIAKFKEDA